MKKFWIIILLAAAVFAAYWVAYGVNPLKKLFGSSTVTTSDTGDTTVSIPGTSATSSGAFIQTGTTTTTKDANGFPLSQGSTGKYVSMIQQALNTRFNSDLVVDGIFGIKTAKSLSSNGFNPAAIYYKHFNEIVGYTYWK